MTVLVTGATGFVGSAVARALLSEGETVRVLVRPKSDRQNLIGLDVAIVEGDLNNSASLVPAVSGCSAVFHVAADYRLWTRNPDDMVRTNVQGSQAVVEAALTAGVERVVYTSSVATLGINRDGVPGDEETPVALNNMIGIYKRSKFLAEEAVQKLIRPHPAGRLGNEFFDLPRHADIGDGAAQTVMGCARGVEGVRRDIADMNERAGGEKALGDGAADARTAGGDDDALWCLWVGHGTSYRLMRGPGQTLSGCWSPGANAGRFLSFPRRVAR